MMTGRQVIVNLETSCGLKMAKYSEFINFKAAKFFKLFNAIAIKIMVKFLKNNSLTKQ